MGVLVTIAPDNHAYVSVANLSNKNTFGVRRENGDAFGIAADVLNGERFASLFVTSIPSLTQFTFEHRTSPNPAKCSYYTATFTGTVADGHYVARLAGSGNCTH